LNGGVGVDLEFFGEAALERTAHYREIMRPHSGRSTLIGYLSFQGEALGGIVFGRSRPGFLDAEQRWLRDALPALSLARAAFRQRSAAGTKILPNVLARLSPREREVLSYLVLGYTNAEIALACGTSFRTVRNQLTSVFRKVGASTRAEAVALSLRQ
jgi:DNA-binding CsgD family transcriptional regulator